MRNLPDPSTTNPSDTLPAAMPLAVTTLALPTLTITASSISKNEGSSGGITTFTFTVRRTTSTLASTVGWSIVHGSTDAADFSGATSGVLAFASGETSKTITISVVGDTQVEASELFSVQLKNPLNAVIGTTGSASSTIVNDDKPRLSIAASNAAVQEGTATANGTTPVLFTVTRNTGLGVSSVKWAIVHRGTNAADFIGPTAGTVEFADGETSRKITVWLVADAVIEPDEAFSVQLSSPTNATLTSATASALVKVANDDLPSLSITAAPTSVSRNEGNTGTTPFTFTVTRSSGIGTSTVSWKVFDVTTDAADFSGITSGVLTFSSGQTSKTITVNVVGDKVGEANELFGVVLSAPSNATLATSVAKVTIVNDDPIIVLPTLSIAATAATQNEGNSGTTPFTFTVTRSSGTGTSSASWTVQHGTTTADDFSGATAGTVTFAAGETSKVITLNVVGDLVVEQDDAFSVLLSSPSGATLGTASASGSILNDDLPVVSISATSADKAEGNSGTTPFTFTVTRSSGVGASWVNWAVTHGTTSAADFSGPTSGTVTFAAGETSKTVTLNVVGDAVAETDEAFRVELIDSNNSSAFVTIGTASASGTIRNDDTVIVPSLSIAATSATKAEGNSGTTPFTFTVTRSSGTGASTVDYTVVNGSTTAADFSAPTSGTVSFASGETSKVITINVAGDTAVEGDEAFSIQLSNATGATIATASASGLIQNDDSPTLSIAATSAAKAEGNSGTTPFTFTVTRSSDIGTSSASWAVQHGTTSADDFSGATSGTVSFAAGQTSQVITLNVAGDGTVETDEAFSVVLSNATGATIGTASASGTIQNDDAATLPTFSIAVSPTSQAEGNSGTTPFTFTVTRSSGTGASTVNWLLASGGADAADFAAGTPIGVNTTLSFAAGETSKAITVNVLGDTTKESDETFSVQLSGPTGATLGASSTASATILDDDTPVFNIVATDADKLEGNGTDNPLLTFTITRSSGSGSASVSYNTVPGTASSGYDYYGYTSGTVVFASGETSKTISITVNSDSTLEYDETFQVVLSNPSTGRLGISTATGTIRNDERMGIDGSLNVTSIAVPTSASDSIENLSDSNWKWGGALGTGARVTYSFSTASSVFTYASGSEVPYTSLTAAQKATAVAAMNLVSSICGITFVEVPDTATSAGDIRWTLSTNGALSTAHAYYPSTGASGGDVWIGPDESYLNPQPGEYGFHTFIHELGHALGLGHPHEGTPAAPAGEDQAKYSVMSYRDRAGSSTSGGYSASSYATSYMLNDIATLQYLYGANTSTNSTDTVYSWASNAVVMQTIWDSGGRDTISAASQSYACRVDLNPGAWSTIGIGYTIYADTGFVSGPPFPVRDTLTIAYGAVIENAVGSAQADTLVGNTVANRLTGGAGADTLTGGAGADVFFFATPTDGGDTITDFVSGTDAIELTSANFAGLPIGALTASRFVSGGAPVAADGNAVFLYNTTSGQLVFDTNGNAAGGTTLIATLSNRAPVTSGDLRIVAASA